MVPHCEVSRVSCGSGQGGAAWVGGGTEHTWGRGKPQWQPFPLVHLAARVWWLCSPPTWRLSADAQWVVPNSDANKRLYGKSGPQLALVTATISHILQKERSDAGMHDTASRPQQSGHTGHTTCMQQPATAGIPPTSCRTPSKQWLGAACCG